MYSQHIEQNKKNLGWILSWLFRVLSVARYPDVDGFRSNLFQRFDEKIYGWLMRISFYKRERVGEEYVIS